MFQIHLVNVRSPNSCVYTRCGGKCFNEVFLSSYQGKHIQK